MLTGARITFPGPDTEANTTDKDLVFRTRSTSVSHQTVSGALTGGSSIIGILTYLADGDLNLQADGQNQQFRLDTGGGIHTTTLQLRNWEGSDDRWGADDGSDWDAGGESALTQLQVLDNAFRKVRVDSTASITLEVGEFSASGRFGPIDVAPREPVMNFDIYEDVSGFSADLDFVDVADLEELIDALQRDGT